jgi:universal stress protein E
MCEVSMNLLCATDLLPKSDAALERAYGMREALDASLKLVHVVPPLAADQGTLEQRMLSASSRVAHRARHAKGPAELVVRCGRPASVVSEEASTADIIIVGPSAGPRRGDPFAGGFTGKLIAEARRPVLVARRPAKEPHRKLLLALDGSPSTARVLSLAERLPVAPDAEFIALHAHEPPYESMISSVGVATASVASYASASLSQAAQMIHLNLERHSQDWHRYRVVLMDARPATAIRTALREFKPDLLVLGTRGHGRFRRALLGSTAHEILGAAECDVLLVPDPARG